MYKKLRNDIEAVLAPNVCEKVRAFNIDHAKLEPTDSVDARRTLLM